MLGLLCRRLKSYEKTKLTESSWFGWGLALKAYLEGLNPRPISEVKGINIHWIIMAQEV